MTVNRLSFALLSNLAERNTVPVFFLWNNYQVYNLKYLRIYSLLNKSDICVKNILNCLSHQTAMPRRLHGAQKCCLCAVRSPQNMPKIVNLPIKWQWHHVTYTFIHISVWNVIFIFLKGNPENIMSYRWQVRDVCW